jgi:hypothetical protein
VPSLPGRHGRPRCGAGGKRHQILFRNSERIQCALRLVYFDPSLWAIHCDFQFCVFRTKVTEVSGGT